MTRTLVAGVSLTLVAVAGVVGAQQPGGNAPLQRGVSVQMIVTRNAVAVPRADTQDALVVALTADGTAYLRATRLQAPELADTVRKAVAGRTDKTLYIKADARVPSARLIEVIDAVQRSGVEGVTLLTAQQDATDRDQKQVPPKGLEMRVVSPR